MCGPKNARSHFSRERMVLASFGFLGVSARPPRTKNCVFSNHIVNNSTYPDAVDRKNEIQI